MKEISKRRYVAGYAFAEVYAALGDKDQAFECLEKSYQDRAPDLYLFSIDPLMDNLRSDPRFADLERRAGLADLKEMMISCAAIASFSHRATSRAIRVGSTSGS